MHSHFKKERSVAFYAKLLDITPKYLSQTIKYVTGKTASDWIDLYVILEAKTLLRSTNEPIHDISKLLNFPNQSFFGKYFKQHVGVAPKDYRKQISIGIVTPE